MKTTGHGDSSRLHFIKYVGTLLAAVTLCGGELEAIVTQGLPEAPADPLPQITSQPRSLSVLVGQPAAFSVGAVDATNVLPVTRLGGPAADRFVYSTGTPRGKLLVDYDFLFSPDRMQIFYEGTELFDTGFVSDSGRISVLFGPGAATEVEIVMNGTNGLIGTVWTYTASILRPPLTYQWQRNGADIPGATNDTLFIPAVLTSHAGQFSVVVANASGSRHSATAILTVLTVNNAPTAIATISPLAALTPGNTNWIVLSPNGSNAPVILDATHSFDTENDPLQFFWFEGESGVILGAGPRLTNAFNAGEHTVTLIADDGTDTGAGDFTFLVLSPGEAVGEVILMLDQSGTPRQSIRPLLATLKASIASLDRGDWAAAANQLRAFLYKIRAQVAPNDPQLGADLTAAVELILQTMGQ